MCYVAERLLIRRNTREGLIAGLDTYYRQHGVPPMGCFW
jgi:hypothetical protein